MKCYIMGAVLGVIALSLVMAPQVRADGIDNFTYTGSVLGGNAITISWSLPSSPTPNSGVNGWFTGFNGDVTVNYTYNGNMHTDSNVSVYFLNKTAINFSGVGHGGFELVDFSAPIPWAVLYASFLPGPGVSTYSGSESAPTFILGTYNLTNTAYGADTPGTLVISTPEPSALLLLLTGLLAAAAVFGLKRVVA